MNYDVIIIGVGPGGIFAVYELMQKRSHLKVAVFESGHALNERRCPAGGHAFLRTLQGYGYGESIARLGNILGGDSGITHSLSHTSASGVYVARGIAGK